MAMGKRRRETQEQLFIATDRLPMAAGHPFYQRLNQLLAEAGFDTWLENRCRQYYAAEGSVGRPSIPPGVYFRMLLVGYFERKAEEDTQEQESRHLLMISARSNSRGIDQGPGWTAGNGTGTRKMGVLFWLCSPKKAEVKAEVDTQGIEKGRRRHAGTGVTTPAEDQRAIELARNRSRAGLDRGEWEWYAENGCLIPADPGA